MGAVLIQITTHSQVPEVTSDEGRLFSQHLLQLSGHVDVLFFFFFFFWFFFSELGTEPRALHFLGKRSTTELNPQLTTHSLCSPNWPQIVYDLCPPSPSQVSLPGMGITGVSHHA